MDDGSINRILRSAIFSSFIERSQREKGNRARRKGGPVKLAAKWEAGSEVAGPECVSADGARGRRTGAAMGGGILRGVKVSHSRRTASRISYR